MRNLLSIGFVPPAPGSPQARELAARGRQHGQHYPAGEAGAYFCWKDRTGAQLWAVYDAYDQLKGLYPLYEGTTRFRVRLEHLHPGRHPLLGSCKVWAAPPAVQGEGGQPGLFAFEFDTPAFQLLQHVPVGQVHEAHICAFAQSIRLYDTPEDLWAAQPAGAIRVPVPAFFPAGLFVTGGAYAHRTRAMVAFTGTVVCAALIENSLTGDPYLQMEAETEGGRLALLCDTQLLPAVPRAGQVFAGNFWLGGSFPARGYRSPEAPRKTFWKRIGLAR
ncbi:MAG: hypothetical protein ACK50T_05260 [Sphingobacteriia bacterium]